MGDRVRVKTWALVASLPLAVISYASAGMGVVKDCPTTPQTVNVTFQCSYTISNTDAAHPITGITVQNSIPCNDPPFCTGATVVPITPCSTTLAPAGSA